MNRACALCLFAATAQCATGSARSTTTAAQCAPVRVAPSFAATLAQWPARARASLVAVELDGRAPAELLLPSMDRDPLAQLTAHVLGDAGWRAIPAFARRTSEQGTFESPRGLSFVRTIARGPCGHHAVFRFDDAQGAADPRWTRASIIAFSWVEDRVRPTLECELEATTVVGPEREETSSFARTFTVDGAEITVRDARSNAAFARARWSDERWMVEPPEACATGIAE